MLSTTGLRAALGAWILLILPAGLHAQSCPAAWDNYSVGSCLPIPEDARIAFLVDTSGVVPPVPGAGLFHIWVSNGKTSTQITHMFPRSYEHVAISPDRQWIAANEVVVVSPGRSRSRLWLIHPSTKRHFAPLEGQLWSAGGGGVDWDRYGFVYFSAQRKEVGEWEDSYRDKVMLETDIYRLAIGAALPQQLTSGTLAGEADVAVSANGIRLAFIRGYLGTSRTEVWTMSPEGLSQTLVYRNDDPQTGVADPDVDDNNQRVSFSMFNPAYHNWPKNVNTAQDIYVLTPAAPLPSRISAPGPICLIPDWSGTSVLYTELSEQDNYWGGALIDTATGAKTRLLPGAISVKWIP